MENDYQVTLRGKIKILYQLEKWQDVSKLCEQYNEQFGKDAEIDLIRFKTDRHLGKVAPTKKKVNVVEFVPAGDDMDEEEPLLLLTPENGALPDQAKPIIDATDSFNDEEPFPQENELFISGPIAESESIFNPDLYEPQNEAAEPMIVDSTTENEKVLSLDYSDAPPAANTLISAAPRIENLTESIIAAPGLAAAKMDMAVNPLAENEMIFSLAGNEPPMILEEKKQAGDAEAGLESPEEELSIIGETEAKHIDLGTAFESQSDSGQVILNEAGPDSLAEGSSAASQLSGDKEKMAPTGPFVSAADIDDRPAQVWQMPVVPETPEHDEERHFHGRETSPILTRKPESAKKFVFNVKYLAVLVLPLAAAVVLWLALSGKLTQEGEEVAKVTPAQVRQTRKPAARQPAAKLPDVTPQPKIDEKEQLVDKKIIEARNLFNNGNALNALAVVLEAKKIKVTEPLSQLEKQITDQLREEAARADEKKPTEAPFARTEDQAYEAAVAQNSIEALEKFLGEYPESSFNPRVRGKIAALEKKAAQKTEQEFQLKVKQAQRLTLRSGYLSLTQVELNAALQKLGQPGTQFEQLDRGGEKVVIDFSSGLMWFLYTKPMTFDKASWWANRNYAGYSGWRLPTVEESQMLQRMNPALYAGLKDFAVWTGDSVGDKARSAWACTLPSGKFSPENFDQLYYVWAVRRAAK